MIEKNKKLKQQLNIVEIKREFLNKAAILPREISEVRLYERA